MIEATAKDYGWKSSDSDKSHAYLVPAVLNVLRRREVRSLLDIGTGNGATLPFWLAEGISVGAMEPDEKGYLFAKDYSDADVRQLGVGDNLPPEWISAFEAVVSLEVVEHLFNPAALVETAKATLKEHGIVIVSTPYHGYVKNLALSLSGKWDFHHHPTRLGGHIKFFSRTTLKELFETGGFKEISFHGAGRLPLLWKSMVMVFQKR